MYRYDLIKYSDFLKRSESKVLLENLQELVFSTIISLEDFDRPLKITLENLYQEMKKDLESHYEPELSVIRSMPKRLEELGLTTKYEHISISKKNKENLVLAHKSMALDIIKKRLALKGDC